MLRVTIRYSSNVFDYPNKIQKILAKHNISTIKTKVGEFKTKTIFYIEDMDKLNDLIYELNDITINQVVVVKIKKVKMQKTSIGGTLLLWLLCFFTGWGLGNIIVLIAEVIAKWLV